MFPFADWRSGPATSWWTTYNILETRLPRLRTGSTGKMGQTLRQTHRPTLARDALWTHIYVPAQNAGGVCANLIIILSDYSQLDLHPDTKTAGSATPDGAACGEEKLSAWVRPLLPSAQRGPNWRTTRTAAQVDVQSARTSCCALQLTCRTLKKKKIGPKNKRMTASPPQKRHLLARRDLSSFHTA